MVKLKRKLSIILLVILIVFQFEEIKALKVYENTGGESKEIPEGDWCDGPYDGCSDWSSNFRVKVTLIDKNMKIVHRADGVSTKTVEFSPYNPYVPGNYGTYYVGKAKEYNGYVGRSNEIMHPTQPHNIILNSAYAVNYSGEANMNYSVTDEQVSETGYWIYMGFGYCEKADENCKPVANNFTDYEANRQKFVNFVKSHERKIHVEDGTFNGDVSFIDFFLKVCGYTDKWDYTVNDEYVDNLEELQEYYLEVEPVFSVAVAQNGWTHRYTATAKFLGNLLWQNDYAWENDGWFGVFNSFSEPRYNYLCAMYDRSSYLDNRYRYGGTTEQRQFLEAMENKCLNHDYMGISTRDMSNYLGWSDSPFGVNILKVVDETIKKEENYNCGIKANSCQNDSFKYELNFTGADDKTIFNCVYPNGIDAEKLDKYFYHIGENGNELWCYDDITYDFSDLKNEVGDKNISSGTVLNLPNGKVKINRTCYSKSDKDKLIGYLDKVFKDDPGTYQKSFDFNFANTTYKYDLNTSKHNDNPENYTVSQFTGASMTQKIYKYTSSFYYNYEVSDAKKDISGINIKNYKLSEAISGTNTINFITKFDNAIVTNKESEKVNRYTNTLSAPSNNSYGLSSKLYTNLQDKTSNVTKELEGTNTYNKTTTLESKKTTINKIITTKVNLSYDETEKNECQAQTTINDNNVLGEGLKFRVISLSNPFPARDGTARMPGENWINKTENNVYNYIQNNRNIQQGKKEKVEPERIYTEKEPIYKVTLDASSMIKIREYNKTHAYNNTAVICESSTGRMCLSEFLRDEDYIENLEGTCNNLDANELPKITKKNAKIKNYIENNCEKKEACTQYEKDNKSSEYLENNCEKVIKQCTIDDITALDKNKDNKIDENDYLNTDYYTCADKTAKSGG